MESPFLCLGLTSLAAEVLSFHDQVFCEIALKENKDACKNKDFVSICQQECSNNTLTCYQCSSVHHAKNCINTVTCNPGQVCSLTGFLDRHYNQRYSMGCANQTQCNIFNNTSKRNTISLAGYCCSQDKCNHQEIDPTPASPACEDISPYACQYAMKTYDNPCAVHFINTTFCRATCGGCHDSLSCFSCKNVEFFEQCRHKEVCHTGNDEQNCGILKTYELDMTTFAKVTKYSMGCMNSTRCKVLNDGTCCHTNLCNNPYITIPSTVTHPTTTATTTTTRTITTRSTTTPTTTTRPTTTPKTTTRPTTTSRPTTMPTTTTRPTTTPTATTRPTTTPNLTTTSRSTTTATTRIPTTTPKTTTWSTTTPTTTPTTTSITYPTLQCDLDFIQIGGSCYYINPEGQTETWEDAKIICMALDSHLVMLETDLELNEMKKYLQLKHGFDRHYSYWTGGQKNSKTNNWEWESTGAVYLPASMYSTSASCHCLEYGPMYDYQWNAGDCHLKSNFICEK